MIKTVLYLLIYLLNQCASFSESILKAIIYKTIQYNCFNNFNKSCSSGGPIVLKSNYKVFGILRKEIKAKNNNFIYHEGKLTKFEYEEFIKKYIINKEINKKIQCNFCFSNNMNINNQNIFYFN